MSKRGRLGEDRVPPPCKVWIFRSNMLVKDKLRLAFGGEEAFLWLAGD